MNLVEIARNISEVAHAGMIDRAGVCYFSGHLSFVAASVSHCGELYEAVGYLHDAIEDTSMTEASLLEELVSSGVEVGDASRVVEAVVAITKIPGEEYFEYLSRVASNEIARVVKIADLYHNSDLSRLARVRESDLARREKYLRAIEYLSSSL